MAQSQLGEEEAESSMWAEPNEHWKEFILKFLLKETKKLRKLYIISFVFIWFRNNFNFLSLSSNFRLQFFLS